MLSVVCPTIWRSCTQQYQQQAGDLAAQTLKKAESSAPGNLNPTPNKHQNKPV
jgi:hypothetical protein